VSVAGREPPRPCTCRLPVMFAMVAAALVVVPTASQAEERRSKTRTSTPSEERLPSPASPEAKRALEAGNAAYREAQSKTDPEVARALYEEAIRQYRAGAVAESSVTYTFWWNLGQSYRLLGEYEEAIKFYESFLRRAPVELRMHRATALDFIEQMRSELDKAATLAEPTGPAPAPIRDDSEPAPRTSRGADSVEVDNPVTGSAGRGAAWYSDRVGWFLVGGGTIAALVGGGFLASGSSLYDEAANEDREGVRANLEDRAAGRVLVGAVAGGVGVAVLAAGLIKLARPPNDPPTHARIQVSVSPSWFSIAGSF